MLKANITQRGFFYYKFEDRYGASCSIQNSSLATEDAIWFGIDDPEPKILASKIKEVLGSEADDGDGTGWVPYPIPNDVLINTRMHLTRSQVEQILPVLQRFVDTGSIAP